MRRQLIITVARLHLYLNRHCVPVHLRPVLRNADTGPEFSTPNLDPIPARDIIDTHYDKAKIPF
jgi:hypothetical protein